MNLEITLTGKNDKPVLIVKDGDQLGFVKLYLMPPSDISVEVSIEELKHALRKVCAK